MWISKGVNEFTFFMALIGFIYIPKHKKTKYYLFVLFFFIFAYIWRTQTPIHSSRYAAALIVPLTIICALYIYLVFRKGSIFLKSILTLFLIAMLLSWLNKSFNVSTVDLNYLSLSYLHDKENLRRDYNVLFTGKDDLHRIQHYETGINPIVTVDKYNSVEDLVVYLDGLNHVYQTALYDLVLNKEIAPPNTIKHSHARSCRNVLSFFVQKNKKKKHNVYLICPKNDCFVLSSLQTIPPATSLLKNGNLESVDSPSDSHSKFKVHVIGYESFFEYSDTFRTPKNAYFHCGKNVTENMPYFNCSHENSISGEYSACIAINSGVGYLLFYQRFSNGEYDLSFLVKGNKKTTVSLVIDMCQNSNWKIRQLATLTIPDKRLYQVSTNFVVDSLEEKDYFLVGALISNGAVVLDNFVLNKTDQ